MEVSVTLGSLCAGGDHILATVTTAQGSKSVTFSVSELKGEIDGVTRLQALIILMRDRVRKINPPVTATKVKTAIESAPFEV